MVYTLLYYLHMKGDILMKIVQESKRMLLNLYDEFSKDESAHSLSIKINMKEFADSVNVSKKNLNLYLCFLNDAEYIKCDSTLYIADDKSQRIITFLPKAIRMLEDDNSI